MIYHSETTTTNTTNTGLQVELIMQNKKCQKHIGGTIYFSIIDDLKFRFSNKNLQMAKDILIIL
jgi:hypothetical protein